MGDAPTETCRIWQVKPKVRPPSQTIAHGADGNSAILLRNGRPSQLNMPLSYNLALSASSGPSAHSASAHSSNIILRSHPLLPIASRSRHGDPGPAPWQALPQEVLKRREPPTLSVLQEGRCSRLSTRSLPQEARSRRQRQPSSQSEEGRTQRPKARQQGRPPRDQVFEARGLSRYRPLLSRTPSP